MKLTDVAPLTFLHFSIAVRVRGSFGFGFLSEEVVLAVAALCRLWKRKKIRADPRHGVNTSYKLPGTVVEGRWFGLVSQPQSLKFSRPKYGTWTKPVGHKPPKLRVLS